MNCAVLADLRIHESDEDIAIKALETYGADAMAEYRAEFATNETRLDDFCVETVLEQVKAYVSARLRGQTGIPELVALETAIDDESDRFAQDDPVFHDIVRRMAEAAMEREWSGA